MIRFAFLLLCLLLPSVARGETWNVWIDPRLPRERVWASLKAWSKVADVHWVESKSQDALVIQYGAIDPRVFDPRFQYVGRYDPNTNTITIADLDPYQVSQTTMHEIGHFLGLWMGQPGWPHCPDGACIMAVSTAGRRKVCRRCVAKVIGQFGPAVEK